MPVIIKIWASDRPGVLDRIAGLIRRKGWNIRTLVAAGVDADLSQIDIALEGRGLHVQSLGEFISEMDAIRGFEECTEQSHLLRGMLVFCLHADERELEGVTDEAFLNAVKQARLVTELNGLRYWEYSGPAAAVDNLLHALRGEDIRCVQTGTVALSLQEGGGILEPNG